MVTSGIVAQLVRASPCHGEGRGFESRRFRHRKASTFVEFFLWVNGNQFVLVRYPPSSVGARARIFASSVP